MQGCQEIAAKIAKALRITGPFNIQFIAKEDKLKVGCDLAVKTLSYLFRLGST